MKINSEITDFIFMADKAEHADIIFIPGGSNPEPAERAAEIYNLGYAKYVLPSGKHNSRIGYFPGSKTKKEMYAGDFLTEFDFLRYVLIKNGVKEEDILREDEALSTMDNAYFSREVTDSVGMKIQKGIICCKSYHARRCLLTYSLAFPEAKLLVCSSEIKGISKTDWFNSEVGMNKVMSEFKKCRDYFAIDFDNMN